MSPRTGRPAKPRQKRAAEGGTEKAGAISHRPVPPPIVVAGRNVPTAPPPGMPETAIGIWEFIVAELATSGIIDKIDLPQLRAFCVQVAREQDAGNYISEPADETELTDLENEIKDMATIANALKTRIATTLRAGLAPDTKDVRAAESYARTLTNLRAYRSAKAKVGNMVALGSTGQLVEHPLLGTERASASILLRFAAEFALTPTARARLGLAVLEGKTLERELEDDLGPAARRGRPGSEPDVIDGEATEA